MKLTVNASGVLGAFKRSPGVFEREIRIAVKEWLTEVQVEARQVHKFVTRSGGLERSVQVDYSPKISGSKVYLELGIARYGPYIHEGFKSWKADRFLTEAAERKKPELTEKISEAIGRAIRKVGL